MTSRHQGLAMPPLMCRDMKALQILTFSGQRMSSQYSFQSRGYTLGEPPCGAFRKIAV